MTKNKFLYELKKGLNILNDEERKKIVNKYSDIIDEKLKSGLTFKEVLADFGDINELIVEILKAYKINPNYKKGYRSDGFTFFEGIEFAIKNISSKLANKIKLKVEDIKDNKNFTLEKILEVLIKFIILMVALVLLKLPFYFLYLLGSNIIYFGHNCISNLFLFVWKLGVFIFYLITCFLLMFLFFYNQFKEITNDDFIKKEFSKKNNKKT